MIKLAYIRKLPNGKYRVLSHKGRNLGTYNSRAAAKERLAQVEMFKYMKNKIRKKKSSVIQDSLLKDNMSNLNDLMNFAAAFEKLAISKKQLEEGTDDELEHTSDREKAKEIAIDHLKKNPHYYSDLDLMETKHQFGDLELDKDKVISHDEEDRPVSYMAFSNLKNCIITSSEMLSLMNDQDELPPWADEMIAISNYNLMKVLAYIRSLKSIDM